MTPIIDPGRIARRLRKLYGRCTAETAATPPPQDSPAGGDAAGESLLTYRNDPVGFITDVLGRTLTDDQKRIARAMPGRIKIEAGHSVGKTFLMAALLLWWFYTRNPSVVVCNAPKFEHLCDVLWAEVRMLHGRAKRPLPDYFIGPRAPEMYDSPDHWAKGFTTGKGESFQGRHHENMLFIFDEDEGIDAIFWTATGTMYQPDHGHGWIASCNPITTSSQSYLESLKLEPSGAPKWNLHTLSSLNHPNIVAGLNGEPPPIPNAVSMGQVNQWITDWTTPVERIEDKQDGDLEWPPASSRFYRPGPIFLARVMGLRPISGVDTVFSALAWQRMLDTRWHPHDCWRRMSGITIGVDAAAFGDDCTVFHVRTGPLSLYHESRNGWGPDRAAGRLKQLCSEWATWYNAQATEDRPPIDAHDVNVNIEFDGGFGVGVHSHADDFYRWTGITAGAGSDVLDPNGRLMYANVRAAFWFQGAELAKGSQMDISRLPGDVKERLRLQLMSPYYQIRPDGSRLVEPKPNIKKRLGRSPDDADAFLISHYRLPDWAPSVVSNEDWGPDEPS